MDLTKKIITMVESHSFLFLVSVHEKHNIPLKKLLVDWEKIKENREVTNEEVEKKYSEHLKLYEKDKKIDKKVLTNITTQSAKSSIMDENELNEENCTPSSISNELSKQQYITCQYIFSRGPNKDTVCNVKTKNGSDKCSKHSKSK